MLNKKNKTGFFKKLFKTKEQKLLEKIKEKKNVIDSLTDKVRFEQMYEKRRDMETKIDKHKEEIIKMVAKYKMEGGKIVLNEQVNDKNVSVEQPV